MEGEEKGGESERQRFILRHGLHHKIGAWRGRAGGRAGDRTNYRKGRPTFDYYFGCMRRCREEYFRFLFMLRNADIIA